MRCCAFMAADGSMIEPVGWGGGVSQTMNDIFEGDRGGDSHPIMVVELGAGLILFCVLRGLQFVMFVAVRHRHCGSCHGLRVRQGNPSRSCMQYQHQRQRHERQ